MQQLKWPSWIGIIVFSLIVVGCTQNASNIAPLTISPGTRLNIDCRANVRVSPHDVQGVPIFVLCRSNDDLDNLKKLNDEVFDAALLEPLTENYRAVRSHIFVVIAVSPRSRCKVDFVPRTNNRHSWPASHWLGGFYSPCDSEVFDMAGRQLKPGRYSPTKFPKFMGNLVVPKYRFVSETEVEFIN